MRPVILLPVIAAGLCLAPQAQSAPLVPDFGSAIFDPGAPIDNPWFPLTVTGDFALAASGTDDEGEPVTETSILSFGAAGPVILGVPTWIQRDRAFEAGVIVEDTLDYYAQDSAGNVWYFGEDVTNYRYDDDGILLGTDSESAWRAGIEGALPGWIMPADPVVGLSYFQEVAPANDALDEALIWLTGATVAVGNRSFLDVLVTLESTELDPDAREFKYYAPGLGLIRADEGLGPDLMDPVLVFERVLTPVPVPPGLPLAAGALAVLGLLRRKVNRSIAPAPG